MTAAKITPATAGADLLARLRQLVDEHETADTLDDVRAIADELTAVLRRARGRIGRLTRKAAPPKPAAAPKDRESAPAGGAAARESNPQAVPLSTAPGRPRHQPSLRRGLSAVASFAVRAARTAARLALAIVRRRANPTPAAEPPPEATEQRAPAAARDPVLQLIDDHPATIPDLNGEQAYGHCCTECRGDFLVTGALKVPVGVSESTGETVFACVGECARQAGHREPIGEQLDLAAGL